MSEHKTKTFSSLKELYDHLEEKTLDYKYNSQIAGLFQKVRDIKTQEGNEKEAKIAQWEVDCFSFNLKGNMISGTWRYKNEETDQEEEYPSLERFDDEAYGYLQERFNSTNNNFLKRWYANLLWCSPKKHDQYAKATIDEYLKLISIYEGKDLKDPKGHFGIDVLNCLIHAFSIAETKSLQGYKLNEIKDEIKRIVSNFNPNSDSKFMITSSLVEFMFERKKEFGDSDFYGLQNICWDIGHKLLKQEKPNIHGAISIFTLGDEIDQKLNKSSFPWIEEVAKAYEMLIDRDKNTNNFAVFEFIERAKEAYEKLKRTEKVSELESLRREIEKTISLNKIETPLDLTDYVNHCRQVAKQFINNNSDILIKALIEDPNLIPNYNNIKLISEQRAQSSPLLDMFASQLIDSKGRKVHDFKKSKESYSFVSYYKIELQASKQILLNEVLLAAIRHGILSSKTFINYLHTNTWLGRTAVREEIGGHKSVYCWLDLITPAINEYFKEINFYLEHKSKYPNLILCIDSLVTKFEGLIREICWSLGLNTTATDRNGNTREKDINFFLRDCQEFKDFIGDDLCYFLKFVMVDQPGYNLRNEVSHTLLRADKYTIEQANWLLIALLKLAKFNIQFAD